MLRLITIILIAGSCVFAADYTVKQSTVDGITYNEFVNSNGDIFAVSWQGIAHPDLTKILGPHYSTYKSELQKHKHKNLKAPSKVETTDIVVEHAGHMRDVRGLAIIKSLAPPGFSTKDMP